MNSGRCPLKCKCNHALSRRQFIRSSVSVVASSVLLQGCNRLMNEPMVTRNPIRACGPVWLSRANGTVMTSDLSY